MSEPLDFSSIGAKKAPAASPQKAPKRQPKPRGEKRPQKGFGWSSRARIGTAVAVVVLIAAVGVVVFGRGGTKPVADQLHVAAATRYCGLANDLDRVLQDTAQGADLIDVPGPVIQDVLTQMGVSMAEMTTTAPAEIRSDVAATVRSLREAANGNLEGVHAATFLKQRQRIDAFRQGKCFGGSGSGEQ